MQHTAPENQRSPVNSDCPENEFIISRRSKHKEQVLRAMLLNENRKLPSTTGKL